MNDRFFILKDEEFDDVSPCIRDKKKELDDIYGHEKYDDIYQLCDFLNNIIKSNDELNDNFMELLEEIRHEFVSISGLKAFDGESSTLISDEDRVSEMKSNIINLDYKKLIKKIDNILE